MKLIYCSFNLVDSDGPPDWISKLKVNPVVRQEKWSIYNPYMSFSENVGADATILTLLNDPQRIAKADPKALKLEPDLFKGLQDVMPRITASDSSASIDVAFKSLYVILRSDLVLVDLNSPGHGEASQEIMYAYLFGIPVIGLAHRFILSPWVVNKVRAVIFPRTTDEIVQQVLAYDHKTTAMIEHYRGLTEAEKPVAEKVATEPKDVEPSPGQIHGAAVPGSV